MKAKLLFTLSLVLLLYSVEAQTFIKRRYSKGFFHERTTHKIHVTKNKTSSQDNKTISSFSGEKTGVLSAPKIIKTQKNDTSRLTKNSRIRRDPDWGWLFSDLTFGEALIVLLLLIISYAIAFLLGALFPAMSFTVAIILGILICLGLTCCVVLLFS